MPPIVRAALVLIFLLPDGVATAQSDRRQILLLYDEDTRFPGLAILNESLQASFSTGLDGRVDFYTESMNLSQFTEARYHEVLRDYYQQKYSRKRLDLIIAVMGPSLDFLLRHGDVAFPGVPIVFCGADPADIAGRSPGSRVSGVLVARTFAPTLDAALEIQPETREVFVVGGTSAFDQHLMATARREFERFQRRVRLTYLVNLGMADLLQTVSRLPPDSVILYVTLFRDGDGRAFVPHEVVSTISATANAPVYVFVDQYLGRGVVGGHVYSLGRHGTEAAAIGLRILAGVPPSEIPVREVASHVNMFDARQLDRWQLDEGRLPAGSVVRFRQPSIWSQYKWYIAGGLILLILQAAVIALLVAARAQRHRAQRTLADRLRFERVVSELSAMVVMQPRLELDREIDRMLRKLVEELDVDRAALVEQVDDAPIVRLTHAWTRPEVAPLPPLADKPFPWLIQRVVAGEVVRVDRVDRLPATAAIDRQQLDELHIRSLAVAPLVVERRVTGGLLFMSSRADRTWPKEIVPRLELLANVFASVIARQRTENAIEAINERRRHAEEEVRVQREELAHALRVATLGELTASLAHELNQPLAAVVTNADAARRLLEAGSHQSLFEILTDISDDAARAGDVIHGLQVMLRKGEVERRPMDLNQVVSSVITLMRHDFDREHIGVRLALDGALGTVLGDMVQLQQVILNLLLNARDALGGVRRDLRMLEIATVRRRDSVVITVRDTGVGIRNLDVRGIFEPFITTKPRGLGMGLSISRSIVEAHGGRIWATRNDDQGTTMHVELPSAGAYAAAG
jgi:signal transduction histidine kinase